MLLPDILINKLFFKVHLKISFTDGHFTRIK